MLGVWIESHCIKTPKDEWPLPSWCENPNFRFFLSSFGALGYVLTSFGRDVAIIFYAHLLSPFKFQKDITIALSDLLWRAEIEFPLARMCAINTDDASKLTWPMNDFPNIPYQTVEFTPTRDHAYTTAENVMDIHGYICGSKHCKKKAYVIPMTEWSKYWVGRAKLICPGCKTTFTNRETKPGAPLEFARSMFGFPIFGLWDCPQRQFGKQGLVDRILALTQAQDLLIQGLIPEHTSRYIKFLQLIKECTFTLVPTLDIDLLWHTHQLSPVAYDKYCKTQVGR